MVALAVGLAVVVDSGKGGGSCGRGGSGKGGCKGSGEGGREGGGRGSSFLTYYKSSL